MSPYETISKHPASIRAIHDKLGFKNKLPKDFTWEGPMTLFRQGWPYSDEPIGVFHVIVIASIKAGKPRIFVKHKGRLVPVGRIAQAKDAEWMTPKGKKIHKALHVLMEELTEAEEVELGKMLVDSLYLRRDREHKGRYQTSWGTKYTVGVYRTIMGQIKQTIKNYETKA